MLSVGALAFLNPWLLAALAALPALWVLLRATPPRPKRFAFPGVRLLLGLEDPERTPDRTPWWLILLRCLIAAAAILAFAEPVMNPKSRLSGDGPALVVMDGGWASAPDWEDRRARALEALDQAERAGRPAALVSLADPASFSGEGGLEPRPAGEWRGAANALLPKPWAPDRAALAARLSETGFSAAETVWITDGLAHDEEGAETLGDALAAMGPLTVIGPERTAQALRAPELVDGALLATALRAEGGAAAEVAVSAFGRGPGGEGGLRRFGEAPAAFEAGAREAAAVFDLPLELRNRVARLTLSGVESAGAVALADSGVRRRRAALVAGGSEDLGQRLLDELHYLRAALRGAAETVEGALLETLETRPDVVFLADIGRFTDAEETALRDWVEAGGLLVRFAGPRLARGADATQQSALFEDPLLPVRLRPGGRSVGGAMAWGAPQAVRPFPESSPFYGLAVPEDVSVSRQILAQLGPDLPTRTWAALEDGTPLVTSAPAGEGRIALFHVTANAEWSSLPLSGLFVEMTRRLLDVAAGGGGAIDRAALEGLTARPVALLDGFGRLADADAAAGAPAERLAEAPGPDAPPGVYAVEERTLAYNLFEGDAALAPAPAPPAGAATETLGAEGETPLGAWLLGLAVLLLAADTAVSLHLSGRLRGRVAPGATAALLAAALLFGAAPEARAQPAEADAAALRAALDTTLAYVRTGDAAADRMSEAGLRGLGRIMTARTAVEPAPPVAVDLEFDELAFFPLLYWAVTPEQPTPSAEAAARLNAFMRSGGVIVFDTRDRHLDIGGVGGSRAADALRRLTARLDLPPLTPVDADHVLTRTFYLLDAFPGRWTGGRVWVEAQSEDDGRGLEGAPERNANDGVSPVIVGAVDWAAAWAVSEGGEFLAPIGGAQGFRQREMAYRFGVNLVMYALTGNYKSDQVHVPALLDRLGQ